MALPDLSVIENPNRLAALHHLRILDTTPEPTFDDIVTIARVACDTPIALVSLVTDDRQWFKATSGTALCETPLHQSVCAHAIVQGSTLVIPDLTKDDRTKDNTLVTAAPYIRFYAGALLSSPAGEILGTLCVIDIEPRPGGLKPQQIEALQALARQVMSALEARSVILERDHSLAAERASLSETQNRVVAVEARLERMRLEEARAVAAQEAGRIGTFEVDLATDIMRCSPELCRILGLDEAATYPATALEDAILRDDRAEASTAVSRRSGSAASVAEYRIRRHNDGAVRWLSRRAEFTKDASGDSTSFIGTIHDITPRKVVEVRQAGLVKLGDAIRDVSSVKEVAEAASRILSETLAVSRVGYARVDFASDTFRVEKDWARGGAQSLQGVYPLSSFEATVDRLKVGVPLVVSDVSTSTAIKSDVATYQAIDTRALIVIPLLRRGTLVGAMFVHNSAVRTWPKPEVDFVAAFADRAYAAIAKVEAEEQQRFLNLELSHRMKNSFSLVQAMASQTLKNAADKEAVAGFRQRLTALSKAHDILLQQNWASAGLRAVMKAVLSTQMDLGQVELDGPELVLGPKAVLSLSILLHELATNATKYGALTAEKGSILLKWHVDQNAPQTMLVMIWQERGGPPATEPNKRGLGSRLISLGIAGTGDTTLRYESSGLTAQFRAPLSLLTEN